MKLRKIFKFRPHDYLLPKRDQIELASKISNPFELTYFSSEIIKSSKIPMNILNSKSIDPIIKLKIQHLQNLPIELPDDLNPKVLKELIKLKEYSQRMKPLIENYLNQLNDEEIATYCNVFNIKDDFPVKFSEISSFEDFAEIIIWLRSKAISQEINKWLLNQSKRLISFGKYDYDEICKVFEALTKSYLQLSAIWDIYFNLIMSHLHFLTTNQILSVCESYNLLKNKFYSNRGFPKAIEQLGNEKIDTFSPEELASLARYMHIFRVPISAEIKNRLKNEKPVDNLDFIYNALAHSIDIEFAEKSAANLFKKGKIEDLTDLLMIFFKFNKFLVKKSELCEKISLGILNTNSRQIEILTYHVDFDETYKFYPMIIKWLENKLQDCFFFDFSLFSQLIGIVSNKELPISESLIEKLLTEFKKHTSRIDEHNISYFCHLFSYSVPCKEAHNLILEKIYEQNRPDTIESEIPDHDNYIKISENEYIVLNNQILSRMSFVDMSILLGCIQMRFQLAPHFKNIINNYTKAHLKNSFFKLNFKFRGKLAFSLALKENLQKEIIDILFENLKISLKYKNRMMTTYSISVFVKNLISNGYTHPLMPEILKYVKE